VCSIRPGVPLLPRAAKGLHPDGLSNVRVGEDFAARVACEDISPDTGALGLWPGSHKHQLYDFGSNRYYFTPDLDEEHTTYVAEQKEWFAKKSFLP